MSEDLGEMTREVSELRLIASEMRRLGIAHYQYGPRVLILGPPPPPAAREDETPEQRMQREKEEQLRVLLHSSGADISPFMEKP